MRFRITQPQDIDRAIELLEANGRCPIDAQWRRGVPAVLRSLVKQDGAHTSHGCVWEEHEGAPLAAFALGVFVHDWFFEGLLAAPQPYYANAFYASVQAGRMPVLTARELAEANARGQLNLLALHYAQRIHDPMHPDNADLRPLGFPGFIMSSAGFGIRRYLFETYGESNHQYLGGIGMRVIHDFKGHADVQCKPADHWPAWSLHRRGDADAACPISALFFSMPNPKLGLTPTQQRVLFAALQGLTDKQVALHHAVSLDSVRQSWDGIYDRCEWVLPPPAVANDGSRRGLERRRLVLEYVGSHPHELRPFKRV
jgi:hypothetical protein